MVWNYIEVSELFNVHITFKCSHLADGFVQSDLQIRNTASKK